MSRGRSTTPTSFFLLLTSLLLIPILFSKPVLLRADDYIPSDEATAPAAMGYQPPAQATSLTDLMAVDTALTPINAPLAFPNQLPEQVSITQTVPITATTLTPLNPEQDTALSLNNDQIGIIIESGTFTTTAALEFTLLAAAPPDPTALITPTLPTDFPTGQDVRLYQTPKTFLSFQVEAVDAVTTQPLTTFHKQVRLAIDVRDQGYTFPQHGTFFLAYRSPEDPNQWIDVPLTLYEPGFYSADVDHFSDWTTGWRPDGWTLTWNPPSADGFTGATTYAYPFQLPPGRNGLQPDLALSYANSALNGATRRVSAGTVAAGWSLNQIAIIRTGVKMASVSSLHLPNQFRLVLNGTGYKLTATTTTLNGGTRYNAESGPQLLILQYGSGNDIYWIIINGDGTHYRLGSTTPSRTWHHLILNEHLANDGDPNTNPTYQQGIIEWHVDTITDTAGNQILYEYNNSLTTDYDSFLTDCPWGGYCAVQLFTKASRLTDLYYNFSTRITSLPPTPTVARLNPTHAATRINLLYHEDGGRFSNLLVYHKSSQPSREYAITSSGRSHTDTTGCPLTPTTPRTTTTHILESITESGWNSATGQRYALPTTQFGYWGRNNYTNNNQPCFVYFHLKWMTNGYGGKIEFDYAHDNRSIGAYTTSGSGPLTYPDLGFSHYTTALRQMDGRGNTSRITYTRHGICYNQTLGDAGTPCPSDEDAPDYGILGGFYRVEIFYWKLDGTTLERQEETFYHTSQDLYGRPSQQDSKDSNGDVRQRTTTTYHTTLGDFHPIASVTTTWYVDGLASPSLSHKVTYDYDPTYQGSSTIQYGNLTHIREYSDAAATTPYRITRRWYKPNTNITNNNNQWHWLVSFLEKEAVYNSETGPALTIQYLHYDGQTIGAAPTKGFVTRARQGDPNTPCSGESGCSYARKTIETSTTYDSYGNPLTTTTYSGYGYQSFNSSHAPLLDTPPTGARTTTLVYDSDYNLYPVQVTDPGGYLTRFDVYGFKNSSGTLVSLDGFSRHTGLLKQVTGPNGLLTLYEYDPFGRLTNVYDNTGDRGTANLPWDGNPVTRYQYFDNAWQGNQQRNPANNKPFPIIILNRPGTYHSGSTGYELKQVVYHDGLGRPIQSQERWVQVDGTSNRQDRIVTTAYDAWGRATCTTIPYTVDTYTIRTGGVGSGFLTASCTSLDHNRTVYDDIGRVTAQYNANNAITAQYEYGITTNITVDGYSKLSRTKVIDSNNHVTGQFTNALGQLVLVREYSGTAPGTPLADTRYTYDLLGQLTAVGTSDDSNAQPGVNGFLRRTTMSYDAYGRKTGMTDADMGTWSYNYDGAGNLTRQQDAKGQVLCFFYDNLNRLTSKRRDYPLNGCSGSDTLLSSTTYFGPGNGSSTGQVQQILWPDSNNRDTFTYNSKGLLETHTRRIEGSSYTLTYGAYDLLNRPTSLTYPNNEVVQMTYDREGENGLTITSSPYTPTGTLVDLVSYNPQGQLVRLERGNGVDTVYSYYEFPLTGDYQYDSGRLRTIQHGGSHDPLPDFKYYYDNVGNIDKIETFATPSGSSTLYLDTQTFSYDEQNRLISASGTGQTALSIAAYQEIYDHDLLGNLIQLGHQGQTTLQYNDSAHKHAATHRNGSSTPSYTYDANGNMTSRTEGSTSYTQLYDVENRLVSVMAGGFSTTFAYDANGQRVRTTATFSSSGRTVTHYPFPNYEVEQQQTWQPGVCFATCPGSWVTDTATQRTLYHLAGQTIATRVASSPPHSSDGLFYFLSDHLGSSRLLTNTSGTAVPGSTTHFLPFGTYRGTPPTTTLSDRGFTGHKHNDPLGLVYMNARFYLPYLNRFISADTIVPDPTNPQNYNRYTYARNNPVNLVDPSGHCEIGADESGNAVITKWDCTIDDFDKLSWEQRILWMNLFMQTTGVDWFYNIIGILEYFANDPDFSNSAWASYSDAGVLQAINDGWRIFKGEAAIGYWNYDGGTGVVSHQTFAAEKWATFFTSRASGASIDLVRSQWGTAEQAGVDYGLMAAKPFANRASSWEQGKIDYFVAWGNMYRSLVEGQAWTWQEYGHGSISRKVIAYFTDRPLDPRTATSQKFVRTFSALVISGVYEPGRHGYTSYWGN